MNARLTPAAATNPDLDAFWMPFTANRQFKANPRLLARAKGMYYTTADGREVLDGVAGLWCVNAGHGRREITEAVTQQLETMEFAPTFQMGHPDRIRTGEPAGEDRATRPGSNLLHQLGFGIRGYRAENRHRLPSRARRAANARA